DDASKSRIAATGFSDQCEGLPLIDFQRNVIDCANHFLVKRKQSLAEPEVLAQFFGGNENLVHREAPALSCSQQRALCPFSNRFRSGALKLQTDMASLQRGLKRQPPGSLARLGTIPLMLFRRVPSGFSLAFGIEASRPRV